MQKIKDNPFNCADRFHELVSTCWGHGFWQDADVLDVFKKSGVPFDRERFDYITSKMDDNFSDWCESHQTESIDNHKW